MGDYPHLAINPTVEESHTPRCRLAAATRVYGNKATKRCLGSPPALPLRCDGQKKSPLRAPATGQLRRLPTPPLKPFQRRRRYSFLCSSRQGPLIA